MNWRNSVDTYGTGTKILHWVIGLCVIGLIGVGLYMVRLDPSPAMFQLYANHKSIGITVLALMVVRLIWRWTNTAPAPLPGHKKWEKTLARAIHLLFYPVLLALPLSGWLMSSAKGFSVSVFGLFTLPDFVRANEALAETMVQLHGILAWGLIAMIALHVGGALKHHIIDRDDTLKRMLP